MAEMKYAIKDSVFTFLFKQPEYTRELYLALHPEDSDVTEADFKLVTLENVLVNGQYNDLGLQVRELLLLLAEAQSTFSRTLALRMLMYLAVTYKEYVAEHKLDLYSGTAIKIPRPELYMIYTGDRRDVPDTIRLSDLFDGDGPNCAEIQVKVLQNRGKGDIVDQYVQFCEVADEQRMLYGYTKKAVEETLRICIERNILASFLTSRKKEVHDIMMTLFDQKELMEYHDFSIAKAAKEEGLQEGHREGREEGIRAMVITLRDLAISQDLVVQKLSEQFRLLPQTAKEKVDLYWKQ